MSYLHDRSWQRTIFLFADMTAFAFFALLLPVSWHDFNYVFLMSELKEVILGLIRLLLALSVVLSHSAPLFGNTLVGGAVAVETFFMISGFYMALVINEKYFRKDQLTKASYILFLEARAMRLFPVYILILVMTLILQAIMLRSSDVTTTNPTTLVFWVHDAHFMQLSSLCLLFATNLFLIGQDAVMFLGVNTHYGGLYFTTDFWTSHLAAWHFLLVPQAWSLGLEISFYIVAPVIVRRRPLHLSMITLISFILKHILRNCGLGGDPWSYRFFPSELTYFVLGALGYRGYRYLVDRNNFQIWWGYLSLICAIASILNFHHLKNEKEFDTYFLLMMINIPLIFLLTMRMKWDRIIGELSYPIYMCHVLIIQVLNYFHYKNSLGVCITVLFFAILLLCGFDQPLERWRKRWLENREQLTERNSSEVFVPVI